MVILRATSIWQRCRDMNEHQQFQQRTSSVSEFYLELAGLRLLELQFNFLLLPHRPSSPVVSLPTRTGSLAWQLSLSG